MLAVNFMFIVRWKSTVTWMTRGKTAKRALGVFLNNIERNSSLLGNTNLEVVEDRRIDEPRPAGMWRTPSFGLRRIEKERPNDWSCATPRATATTSAWTNEVELKHMISKLTGKRSDVIGDAAWFRQAAVARSRWCRSRKDDSIVTKKLRASSLFAFA